MPSHPKTSPTRLTHAHAERSKKALSFSGSTFLINCRDSGRRNSCCCFSPFFPPSLDQPTVFPSSFLFVSLVRCSIIHLGISLSVGLWGGRRRALLGLLPLLHFLCGALLPSQALYFRPNAKPTGRGTPRVLFSLAVYRGQF